MATKTPSVLDRLKRNAKPGQQLLRDATPAERASLFAPIEQALAQNLRNVGERLNTLDLQNNGDLDSIGRAGRIAGLSASDVDDMTLNEIVDEVAILNERDNRLARKIANAMQPRSPVIERLNKKRPRNDEPTDADLLIGRQVLAEMVTRNPSVEMFRTAVRAKGLKISNAKLGKVLDRLQAEKKMPK